MILNSYAGGNEVFGVGVNSSGTIHNYSYDDDNIGSNFNRSANNAFGKVIMMDDEDRTEIISSNGSFGAITNIFWEQSVAAVAGLDPALASDVRPPPFLSPGIDGDVEAEYIFDRLDVRIIFITLYSIVFGCCFFGKKIWNSSLT